MTFALAAAGEKLGIAPNALPATTAKAMMRELCREPALDEGDFPASAHDLLHGLVNEAANANRIGG